jgi:predicted chitinase
MFEMLRSIEGLQPGDLTQLWARRFTHGTGLNLPRITYARDVVLSKALPAIAVGDLRQTGQVADAADFLAEKLAKVVPKSVNPSPVSSISLILQECNLQSITDKSHIAYVLASAHHESAMGRHMTEFASGKAYEGRKDLGNTQPGDGQRFKGRGFVQITGRKNYTKYKQLLKTLRGLEVDLVNDPVRATEPAIAAFIIAHGMKNGTFTGRKLLEFGADPKYDFVNARKIVNGLDKAQAIAGIARKYRAVMA